MASIPTTYSLDSVLNDAKDILVTHYGDNLSKVILYGSFARQEQTSNSDIDILIVLKDGNWLITDETIQIAALLAPLDLKYEVNISGHPASEGKWLNSDFLFYKNVRKDGIEI